jgi:hypothetical protein
MLPPQRSVHTWLVSPASNPIVLVQESLKRTASSVRPERTVQSDQAFEDDSVIRGMEAADGDSAVPPVRLRVQDMMNELTTGLPWCCEFIPRVGWTRGVPPLHAVRESNVDRFSIRVVSLGSYAARCNLMPVQIHSLASYIPRHRSSAAVTSGWVAGDFCQAEIEGSSANGSGSGRSR